eukprot:g70749.t1
MKQCINLHSPDAPSPVCRKMNRWEVQKEACCTRRTKIFWCLFILVAIAIGIAAGLLAVQAKKPTVDNISLAPATSSNPGVYWLCPNSTVMPQELIDINTRGPPTTRDECYVWGYGAGYPGIALMVEMAFTNPIDMAEASAYFTCQIFKEDGTTELTSDLRLATSQEVQVGKGSTGMMRFAVTSSKETDDKPPIRIKEKSNGVGRDLIDAQFKTGSLSSFRVILKGTVYSKIGYYKSSFKYSLPYEFPKPA